MGSDIIVYVPDKKNEISIHAPRVGSDKNEETTDPASVISIHAPRVGSDIKSNIDT